MAHDLLIVNGTVLDGSGGAGRRADVAVSGGRISEIGDLDFLSRQDLHCDDPRCVNWRLV